MYTVETINAGFLVKQDIDVVKIPRATFLALVDETLKGGYERLRSDLMPVAEKMIRFPMGDWINEERGCGCVVGEYLVATSEVSRAALAEREASYGAAGMTVRQMLAERGTEGAMLREFGEAIDEEVRDHVRDNLEEDEHGDVPSFQAVEIVG